MRRKRKIEFWFFQKCSRLTYQKIFRESFFFILDDGETNLNLKKKVVVQFEILELKIVFHRLLYRLMSSVFIILLYKNKKQQSGE